MTVPDPQPVLFTFGLHAHQPVGNFDHVFEEHLQDVYRPFLDRAVDRGFFPMTLHISGPLLDWLEDHGSEYLDLVGRLAADGQLELLMAGYYEPILPALCREDRLEQIGWLRDAIQHRFGVRSRGLWLTERVWEPELPADLAEAGVEFVLVDDRHFVAAGFSVDQLHTHFRTEACGKGVSVFPIDEKLRYLIPFHAPEDTATYIRELRSKGQLLAVAADDIEKFGGWPGTKEWVYEKGWLDGFMRVMDELTESGEVRLATFKEALETVPSGGPAYLPTASYREMEEWALPVDAGLRLAEMKKELGEERITGAECPLVRGSNWKNFMVKYPEANRMHKKMMALSHLCRERGNPEGPRRAIGRAQCNDVYWHGVFGGLYLRHLRDPIWANMAEAEGMLREGEELVWEERDLDLDGHDEIWVHSSSFSALVSPDRGGAVEELTLFNARVNLANTLTRRREIYHKPNGNGDPNGDGNDSPDGNDAHGCDADGGTPSIHDLEEGLRFSELPPVDLDDRALFVERILPGDLKRRAYQQGEYEPLWSWAGERLKVDGIQQRTEDDGGEAESSGVGILLSHDGPGHLWKEITLEEGGSVSVHYRWDPSAFPGHGFFAAELSLGADAKVDTAEGVAVWRFPISTFSKSEKGFDETVQGESVTVRWPVRAGEGWIRLSVE